MSFGRYRQRHSAFVLRHRKIDIEKKAKEAKAPADFSADTESKKTAADLKRSEDAASKKAKKYSDLLTKFEEEDGVFEKLDALNQDGKGTSVHFPLVNITDAPLSVLHRDILFFELPLNLLEPGRIISKADADRKAAMASRKAIIEAARKAVDAVQKVEQKIAAVSAVQPLVLKGEKPEAGADAAGSDNKGSAAGSQETQGSGQEGCAVVQGSDQEGYAQGSDKEGYAQGSDKEGYAQGSDKEGYAQGSDQEGYAQGNDHKTED